VVLGLHLLGVSSLTCGALPLGSGQVRCAHGVIPVPVPATVALALGLPTVPGPGAHPTGELVTPTGAALLRTLVGVDGFGAQPPMRLARVGVGFGSRDRGDVPNVLRLLVGEAEPRGDEADAVDVLTTTVDDLEPRLWPPLLDGLLAAGALDATVHAVQGKKGRLAMELVVLSPPDVATRASLEERIFLETTTLGIRRRREDRTTLPRRSRQVETPWGVVRVKEGLLAGRPVTVQPEFDDCRALAQEAGVPLREVIEAARDAARRDPE